MTLDLHTLDPCVHCGFCLQSCPTYLVTSDEADGPRGRIGLMQDLGRGRFPDTDRHLRHHLDRCLGCRACETACPSGVGYGYALEEVRQMLSRSRTTPWQVQFVNAVMANRRVRKGVLGAARLLRPIARRLASSTRHGFMLGMLGATRADRPTSNVQRPTSKGGASNVQHPTSNVQHPTPHIQGAPESATGPTAALFAGCIMDELFDHVHRATERVLVANGYHVIHPEAQGCCGALHTHSGDRSAAVRLARDNVRAFASLAPDTMLVVNSAGCGAMLREYPHLLADDPLEDDAHMLASRVRDVTELLADAGPRTGAELRVRVAYDAPCHLLHAQRVTEQPLAVLDAIPGLELVVHDEADLCCGSAGSFTLAEPDMSRAVLERKLGAIRAVAPDVVVTGNPGCIMQIGGGLLANGDTIEVMHPIELLDLSYESAGLYERTDD